MTTRRRAPANDSLEMAELRVINDQHQAHRRAEAERFREEWEAKMASSPPPAPIHVSPLHVHDDGCFDGQPRVERRDSALVYTGRVCRRTGGFQVEDARAAR